MELFARCCHVSSCGAVASVSEKVAIKDSSFADRGSCNLSPSPASQRVAIASAIGSFNNLAGIPNIPNVSKGKFFNGALNPNPYTVDSRVPRYFRDANRKYLEDRKGGLQGVIDNIGTQLGTAGAGKTGTLEYQAIADAWGTFARAIYQDVINRLASR